MYCSPFPPVQSCDGTIAKLRSACHEMGRPDAVKVVDRCMEERSIAGQHLGVAGGRRGVHTAPGVCVCVCVCLRVRV